MKLPALIILLCTFNFVLASDKYPVNGNLNVTQYEFSVYLSDSYDMIRGEAFIRISHTGPSPVIMLDLTGLKEDGKGMVVERLTLNEEEVEWVHVGNELIITPETPREKGETSRILINYFGVPGDGLIISQNRYGDRTFFADNWPDRARNWIPCIDHPSDKAPVDFKVYAPSHYKVVSNGHLVEESILNEGIKLTHWKEEVSIPTRVMVIGAARFAARLAGRVGGTEIWSYVYPEDRENGFNDYSLAVKPFTFFSEQIGSYSYEKLANVQSKTIFGGMENAGCIFYSERSVTGKGESERLMAHEIAHQWFGNSVTEKDWNHIWLSEGFATYFTAYYQGSVYGEPRLRSIMLLARNRVMSAYERNPAPVVDTTITDLMDLLSTYSYQKGAWVLHMLRSELGDGLFMHGISTFYSRYRNRNALTSDFRNTMEEISGRDLDQFFNQWLYLEEIPDLEISWTYSPRRREVIMLVEQVQPGNAFRFPLDIEILTEGDRVLESVEIDEKTERLTFRADSRPTEINLDPDVKLLYH